MQGLVTAGGRLFGLEVLRQTIDPPERFVLTGIVRGHQVEFLGARTPGGHGLMPSEAEQAPTELQVITVRWVPLDLGLAVGPRSFLESVGVPNGQSVDIDDESLTREYGVYGIESERVRALMTEALRRALIEGARAGVKICLYDDRLEHGRDDSREDEARFAHDVNDALVIADAVEVARRSVPVAPVLVPHESTVLDCARPLDVGVTTCPLGVTGAVFGRTIRAYTKRVDRERFHWLVSVWFERAQSISFESKGIVTEVATFEEVFASRERPEWLDDGLANEMLRLARRGALALSAIGVTVTCHSLDAGGLVTSIESVVRFASALEEAANPGRYR